MLPAGEVADADEGAAGRQLPRHVGALLLLLLLLPLPEPPLAPEIPLESSGR